MDVTVFQDYADGNVLALIARNLGQNEEPARRYMCVNTVSDDISAQEDALSESSFHSTRTFSAMIRSLMGAEAVVAGARDVGAPRFCFL